MLVLAKPVAPPRIVWLKCVKSEEGVKRLESTSIVDFCQFTKSLTKN